jgi:hypothetical protein
VRYPVPVTMKSHIIDLKPYISIFKTYFASLGESAHPHASDPRMRSVTRFQELLVVAFKEFALITDETIASERKRFRAGVVDNIESFAKRAAVRNLRRTGRFDKNQLGTIYDQFQLAVLKARDSGMSRPLQVVRESADERPEVRIDRGTFGIFLSEIASWARNVRLGASSNFCTPSQKGLDQGAEEFPFLEGSEKRVYEREKSPLGRRTRVYRSHLLVVGHWETRCTILTGSCCPIFYPLIHAARAK